MLTRRGFFGLLAAVPILKNWDVEAPPIEQVAVVAHPEDLWSVPLTPSMVNSALFGLKYYQVSANTGSYMGISRSSYPGAII